MLNRWHSHTMQALANRGQPADEVWYWAAEKVTLYSASGVISHTFVDGLGKIKYNAPLDALPSTLRGTPITGVLLPSGITAINNNALFQCILLDGVVLPDGVTSIGQAAFSACAALTRLVLPSALETIAKAAFSSCPALVIDTIPASVTSLGANILYGNNAITELTFLSTPTTIATNTLNYIRQLATIRVPWSEGAVAGAPWGARNATIIYDYTPS